MNRNILFLKMAPFCLALLLAPMAHGADEAAKNDQQTADNLKPETDTSKADEKETSAKPTEKHAQKHKGTHAMEKDHENK